MGSNPGRWLRSGQPEAEETKMRRFTANVLALSVVVMLALSACGGGTKETFVLVHGAWMGAWVWDDVAATLRARGETVVALDLPAHGASTAALSDATLDNYVAAVAAEVDAAAGPVVLVGHSMGGFVITQVAENRPTAIEKLVYVAGYVPTDGQTLMGLAGSDAGSHLGPALQIDPMTGTAAVPANMLQDIFCADCSATELASLQSHYRDEPLQPFAEPVHLTGASASVPKFYVYTQADNAISYPFQLMMTQTGFKSTTKLNSSHSPFLSQPDAVAAALSSL
jgi:pimeloyl-ACP methyl ester carboxylesterase